MKRHFSTYFVRRPVELGVCGKKEDVWGADAPEARRIIKEGRFPDLHTFTQIIGELLGKDPLSEAVAEAYWLGNNKTVSADELCKTYLKNGKTPEVVEELRRKYAGYEMPLTHLAQIIMVTDDTKVTNGCMVARATIAEAEGNDTVMVERDWIVKKRNGYEIERKRMKVKNPVINNLKSGDVVAIHQGEVAMRLTERQVKRLERSNRTTITRFNTFLGKSD